MDIQGYNEQIIQEYLDSQQRQLVRSFKPIFFNILSYRSIIHHITSLIVVNRNY